MHVCSTPSFRVAACAFSLFLTRDYRSNTTEHDIRAVIAGDFVHVFPRQHARALHAALDASGDSHVRGLPDSAHFAAGALAQRGMPVHFIRRADRPSRASLRPRVRWAAALPHESELQQPDSNAAADRRLCFQIARGCSRLLAEDQRCAHRYGLAPLKDTAFRKRKNVAFFDT